MSKEVGKMVRSRDVVQAEGSARTEGARRATGVPADGAAAGAGSLAPGQRWSASRKRDVVLRLLCGESLEALSREVGVEIYRLDAWRARAMAGLEFGLKARHGEPVAEVLDAAKRHIGELIDGDRAAPRAGPGRGAAPPFGDAEVARPSVAAPDERDDLTQVATAAATGRCFGIQRVCQVWERSRSALYARRARAHHHRLGAGPARRGPPPRQSDAQLLAAIRTDLARSPFHGEGHRKVHARLRILDGIRVARTRVLRVMRAHGLLSPHRGRQGAAKTHDGRVITQAPNVMWGTDGVRVFTLDDGWGWIFAAVEHWNAECVGWHVCKVGSRFAALDPIAQGLERLYGSLDADVARGLALRMDHGSQYLSDHFLKQIRYWGVHPSFGFVEEPETNGVAERWNRTLKEQAIHGRIFQNLEAVRAAVANFVERFTTRPGVSRSLGIKRRSRRARSMSYARRHSTNVCPGNRVRYILRLSKKENTADPTLN